MGKVVFIEPIDHISGKIAKSHKVGYAHRKAATTNTGNPNFTCMRGPRKTQPKQSEIARWTRFGAVGRMVQERRKDFSQNTIDQENFANQTRYKTMYQYLWNLCADEYDAQQG